MQELPDSFTVRTIDMPTAVCGTIAESPDGHINIYINARLSHAGQIDALEHELEHWRNDDLNNEDDDIRTIEYRADHMEPTARLVRAKDIKPPKPKPNRITAPQRAYNAPQTDWQDDIYNKLPMHD